MSQHLPLKRASRKAPRILSTVISTAHSSIPQQWMPTLPVTGPILHPIDSARSSSEGNSQSTYLNSGYIIRNERHSNQQVAQHGCVKVPNQSQSNNKSLQFSSQENCKKWNNLTLLSLQAPFKFICPLSSLFRIWIATLARSDWLWGHWTTACCSAGVSTPIWVAAFRYLEVLHILGASHVLVTFDNSFRPWKATHLDLPNCCLFLCVRVHSDIYLSAPTSIQDIYGYMICACVSCIFTVCCARVCRILFHTVLTWKQQSTSTIFNPCSPCDTNLFLCPSFSSSELSVFP